MNFLSLFSILIFLYGCQSSVNSLKNEDLNASINNTEKRNNSTDSKKQLNEHIYNTSSTIAKQLNECQGQINYFQYKTNEYFTKSIFLYNLKQLETIDVYYKDNNQNEQVNTIKPLKHTFEDDFLVISENKQYNALNYKAIKLDNPSNIYFLNIEYIDRNNKLQYKPICIDVENRKIENNNLFLYENKYYFHDTVVKNKKHNKIKPNLHFKKIPSHHSLKIFYSEDDKYFYLKVIGCKKNYVCKEPKYIQRPKNKIAILKFNLKGNHTQKIQNFYSKHIKRIEVGFQGGTKANNHLVIESKDKKITNIRKMNFDNEELIYKIEF